MKRIAKFMKVSFDQFKEGYAEYAAAHPECPQDSREVYEHILLPKRATAGSAGYDFFAPADITLNPGETVKVPTGIRVRIEPGWVLMCYPRSGLGFKYRLQLDNTVGVIDSDYYGSDNEGHIFLKLTNDTKNGKTVQIKEGTGFAQGIFTEFGITEDDAVTDIRNGGFGSTSVNGSNAGEGRTLSCGNDDVQEAYLYIPQDDARYIQKALTHEPKCESEVWDEDDKYSKEVVFADGTYACVEICGVQYQEGESNLPWTQAVLYRNGNELSFTEPEVEFFGDWELYNGDKKYIVHVVVCEAPDM